MPPPPRCPKCRYALVFFENRAKYKCPKCSKLFLKREIEDKSFRTWNRTERKKDAERFDKLLESRRQARDKSSPKKEDQTRLKEFASLTPEERADRRLARKRKRNASPASRDKQREWNLVNRDKVRGYQKTYESNKVYENKLKKRLAYWRARQREMVVKNLSGYL